MDPEFNTRMPSKVFISGALGFIGSVLADRYRKQGAEVRGVDLRADPALGVVAGDISEPGEWQEHAQGCDLVINTAAYVGFGGDLDAVWRANVLGARRGLHAAGRAGGAPLVQVSSGPTLRLRHPGGGGEAHPGRPAGNPHPDSKNAAAPGAP